MLYGHGLLIRIWSRQNIANAMGEQSALYSAGTKIRAVTEGKLLRVSFRGVELRRLVSCHLR